MKYKVGDSIYIKDIRDNKEQFTLDKYIPDKENYIDFYDKKENKIYIGYKNKIILEIETYSDLILINGKKVEAGDYIRCASSDYVIKKYGV